MAVTSEAVSADVGAAARASSRIAAVDLLRGLVIALMALDHTRDYFHISGWGMDPLDPAESSWPLYLTRWVTHLCAPTFVLLAGASAFFQHANGKDLPTLSRFLITRGLWLVALELTLVGFGWSFALPFAFLLQVIWAIGWCMVGMAGVIWLGARGALILGLVIIAGHNLLDPVTPQSAGPFALAWTIVHEGGPIMIGQQPIGVFAYPLLPWLGVMAFGYGLGAVFRKPAKERDTILVSLGALMLLAFAVLRGLNLYGDPRPWTPHADVSSTLMDLFDVEKYPPSLAYVCATLGIVFVATPLIARLRGLPAQVLGAFGAVPLFAYLLHIYLVHTLAIIWAAFNGRPIDAYVGYMANVFLGRDMSAINNPLWVVYAAWLIVLAILYPLCRWFANVKRTRKDWWLAYL